MQGPLSFTLERLLDEALAAVAGQGVVINNHTQDGDQIRSQVQTLGRIFDFVELKDLQELRRKKRAKPFCVITFDDGKKVNLDAADVLREHGVPATFFVCSDFIGGSQLLWFDELASLLMVDKGVAERFGLSKPKSLPFAVIRARLDEARESIGVEVDASDPRMAPMSWDEVRTLARNGFSIGAHGKTHAILTNETESEGIADIRDSMARVEQELGDACESFAFPNGNYNVKLASVAFEAGAQFVFTTEPTWVHQRRSFTAVLPRIQLHEKHRPAKMKTKLLAARAGFILRDPNGTGRRYLFYRDSGI